MSSHPEVVVLSPAELIQIIRDEIVPELLAASEASHPSPALLSRHHLARELGVSVSTVDRLRSQGMPSVAVIDSRRFHLNDVLEWIKSREEEQDG